MLSNQWPSYIYKEITALQPKNENGFGEEQETKLIIPISAAIQ